MIEIIKVIALLCSLDANDFAHSIEAKQTACHKYYMGCMKNNTKIITLDDRLSDCILKK